jgi:Domain of unknown function (DUF4331)
MYSMKRVSGMIALTVAVSTSGVAFASSHREAPFITKNPKVDSTDFYMFRSYEPGRENFVTLIANYLPLQAPYGGPNYFTLDPEAAYDIHIDNNGDAKEDLTFRFQFRNDLARLSVPAGGQQTAVPLHNIGMVSAGNVGALNIRESYTVRVARGDLRDERPLLSEIQFWDGLSNARTGERRFTKPSDNVGTKTFGPAPAYANYAKSHIYDVRIPRCNTNGRLFVGQRRESFAVNLGTIFDLVNAPANIVIGGINRAGRALVDSIIGDDNITTLALELPISCVKGRSDVIAAWTSAKVKQVRVVGPDATYEHPSFEAGAFTQISRLSMPLANELVIGLPDKDTFSATEPRNDAMFASYVTNPSLPELLEILFGADGVAAPNLFPRADLVAAFLTGVPGVNANGSTAEMQRLNLAIPVTPRGQQNSLGAAQCFVFGALTLTNPGCDPAGFPNGRRPGDDVVDIELRVAMGFLLPQNVAPSGQLAFTDATLQEDVQFDNTFPYLVTPVAGAGE